MTQPLRTGRADAQSVREQFARYDHGGVHCAEVQNCARSPASVRRYSLDVDLACPKGTSWASACGQRKRYPSPLPGFLSLIIAEDRKGPRRDSGQRGHARRDRQKILFTSSGGEEDVGVRVLFSIIEDLHVTLVFEVRQEVLDLLAVNGVTASAARP